MDFQPTQVLILATGAVLAPLVAELAPFRIPVVVVEIARGSALGPHVIGLIRQDDELLAPLSTLGLAFLIQRGRRAPDVPARSAPASDA
jgi:Kef-type K+ transport system membrane component KefB